MVNKTFLTPHFTLGELTATSAPLDNAPSQQVVINLTTLSVLMLEPLRLYLGAPIVVTSGFRSPAVNKYWGGVPNSQHLTGCAADIRVYSESDALRKFSFLKTLPYCDQLLFEHSKTARWIHVSFSWSPRHIFNYNYKV